MILNNNEQFEYNVFINKYLDKLKDFNYDFNRLSEYNKSRIMLLINNYLPAALCNFENELKKYNPKK